MKIEDWQLKCLTIEQQVKLAMEQATIDSITPLLKRYLEDASIVNIAAKLLAKNEFAAETATVEAFTRPYLNQDVFVIKINK